MATRAVLTTLCRFLPVKVLNRLPLATRSQRPCCFRTLKEPASEVFDTQQRLRPVNGPMAVGTEHSQVLDAGHNRLCGLRKGAPVMNLAKICFQTRVRCRRAEAACFTAQKSVRSTGGAALRFNQPRIPFTDYMEVQTRIALDREQLRVRGNGRADGCSRAIRPRAYPAFAIEELAPARSADGNLLREPSNHVRCRAAIVQPCVRRPSSGLCNECCSLSIRQDLPNDCVVSDVPKWVSGGSRDQMRNQRKGLCKVKGRLHGSPFTRTCVLSRCQRQCGQRPTVLGEDALRHLVAFGRGRYAGIVPRAGSVRLSPSAPPWTVVRGSGIRRGPSFPACGSSLTRRALHLA